MAGADRTLTVKVTGDTSGLGRSFNQASKSSKSLGDGMQHHLVGGFKAVGRAAEYAGSVIGISFVAALGDGIRVAAQNQVAVTKLRKAVDNSGLSWKKLGDQLQTTQDKMAGLSGFTNTDLETSLATLITTTGKVTSAQHLQNEAMDLARAKSIPLANATTLLSKVYNGNTTSLTRLGISLPKTTAHYDAYIASTKHATEAGKAAAKQADVVANRQSALAALQKKFGGSYQAYAQTASGALGRIRASADILLERLGNVLLPYLNRFAAWFAKNLPEIQRKATTVFGAIKQAIIDVVNVGKYLIGFYDRWTTQVQAAAVFVGTLVVGIEAYILVTKGIVIATKMWTAAQVLLDAAMSANPIGIAIVAAAALAAAFVILWKRSGTFRDIVRQTMHDIQTAFNATVGFVRQHWQTMLAILTGGFSIAVQFIVNHWATIRSTAQRVITFVIDRFGNIKHAFSSFGGWVTKYILGPIEWIIKKAKEAWSWISKINIFGGSGSASTAPGNARMKGAGIAAEQQYASSQLHRYGWGQNQMQPLVSLWNQESGWNPAALNSAPGHAEGIPQLLQLPGRYVPPGFPSTPPLNAAHQIDWGLGYIHGAYPGGPAQAWAQDVAGGLKGYDTGGIVPGRRGSRQMAMVHGGETILPTHKTAFQGQQQIIVVPVILERDFNRAVQKANRENARVGNASLVGGYKQR